MKMVHQAAKRAQQQQRQFQALVVGTHTGAGKTTLLDRWLTPGGGDVKDVKPTLALEYKYFKRPGRGAVAKEVAHVWELGSGTKLAKLIDAPLNEATVRSTVVVIVADLSKPQDVFQGVRFWLARIKERLAQIDKSIKAKTPAATEIEKLRDMFSKRFGEKHPDNVAGKVRHTGMGVVIVATKFDHDAFKNKSPELKKVMAKALRFLAHSHGAALVYHAQKEEPTLKNFRDLMNHYLFKVGVFKSKNASPNDALFVPAGLDSFKEIELQGVSNVEDADAWGKVFSEYFGDSTLALEGGLEAEANVPLDPNDKYAESAVDEALKQSEEDLRLKREAQSKEKLETRRTPAAGPPAKGAPPVRKPSVARDPSKAAAPPKPAAPKPAPP